MSFLTIPRSGIDPENFTYSLVTGGEVSRVDPESTGLNPAWRKSLVYATLGTSWQDGANSTQIDTARQLLIQDMKILEGIAPESGAYLNEVRVTLPVRHSHPTLTLPSDWLLRVGFEIRIRLEEVLLWLSLRSAPSYQAEIRPGISLPSLRRDRIRWVGRRSHLQSLKPLRTPASTEPARNPERDVVSKRRHS